ncbi:hypothetical protein ACWA1C_09075 [Flectobacillus roseus]
MVLIRKSGNMYWELLKAQKDSVQMSVKEQLSEKGFWRVFQDTYSRPNYPVEKAPIVIIDVISKNVLPEEIKTRVDLSDYEKLVVYHNRLLSKSLI